MERINTVLWDWNGTLLNDSGICIDAINILLQRRRLQELSRSRYLEIFTFPVKDYYTEAGFRFSEEPWDLVAMEFMHLYFEKLKSAEIFNDANEVLGKIRKMGIRQVMISAMEHDSLTRAVKEKGLSEFFESIAGIEDHYAGGKTENARNTMARLDIDPGSTVFIGDTIHDHEVAGELGVQCILVSRGHQSFERLLGTGRNVFPDLKQIVGYICNNHQMS
jgi:phosphoglycolate phosphatase